MLSSILEFRKGILFVRLEGVLNKKTVEQLHDVVTLVKENDIINVVFNLEKVSFIDIKGINFLLYVYELSKKKNGKSLLCGINSNVEKRIKESHILNYIKEAKNELRAFDIIHI
ncbi:MAG: STAS domain-containing protein [Bacilli bacterium]|nr:STAS domain-containing protein [Bacilli bacterium]